MEPISLSLLIILLSIIAYIIYYANKINQYWQEKGLPHEKPILFLGNNLPLFRGFMYPDELHESICNKFPNQPLIGFYDFITPKLLVKDLDYIERVLIKDFGYFVDHGLPLDEKRNPLHSNLFSMCGKRWKALRIRLSPIFTSGKLKSMFESISNCGVSIINKIEKENHEDLDVKEILGCFVMDSIGSCAFGIETGNLSNPNNEFRRMGNKALAIDRFRLLKFFIFSQIPPLRKLFNITFIKQEFVEYFSEIINDTLKYRRENGFKRNDFVQQFMQLQDKGYVEMLTKDSSDDYLDLEQANTAEKFEMSDEQLTGHAVTFLTAGFEGMTNTMLYTLYEISKHQEIQDKIRQEILNNLNNQDGGEDLNYDVIKKLNYMEQCIKEAMRKYSPSPMLMRMCTKDYTFPNGYTINAGEHVIIPIRYVHYNPKYYPDPEKYDPERFNPDNNLRSCTFIPFGDGPRICIGMRFALLQIKFCLAKLLLNYNFKLSPKTKEPLLPSQTSMLLTPRYPVYFNLTKLNVN